MRGEDVIPEFTNVLDVSDVFDDHFGASDALLLGPFTTPGHSGAHRPSSVHAQIGSLRAFPVIHATPPLHPLVSAPAPQHTGFQEITTHPEPIQKIQHHELLSIAEEKAKKKAQNRAAQKAFRERKEARMKELEDKLDESNERSKTLLREIDTLKMMNMEIHTENQFLRQQVNEFREDALLNQNRGNNNDNGIGPCQALSPPASSPGAPSPQFAYSFPTKDTFFKSLMVDKYGESCCTERYPEDVTKPDVKILTVNGTWEYILRVTEGQDVDVFEVMRRMMDSHICTEEGPSYTTDNIHATIKQLMSEGD